MSRPRNRLSLLRVVSILLILVLGIIGLEATGRAYMHIKYGVPGKSYGRWRADRILGARMAENVYDHRWQTNDRGFRNDEDLIEPKPPEAWRVITYGGSATLCWNLPTQETWPSRLEQRLREIGSPSHQVLNAGDILWSIGHIYARAKSEIPELKPDFVILYAGINEVWNARLLGREGRPMEQLVAAGEYGVFSQQLPQNRWLVRESLVYKVIHKFLIKPVAKRLRTAAGNKWPRLLLTDVGPDDPPIPPDADILDNYLRVLERIVDLCWDEGATPIFVVQAYGWRTVGLDHFTSYSREGAKLAQRIGVVVIDAQEIVDRYDSDPTDLFRESGIHYSSLGATMLAEKILQEGFRPSIDPKEEADSTSTPALSLP